MILVFLFLIYFTLRTGLILLKRPILPVCDSTEENVNYKLPRAYAICLFGD